MLLKSTPAPALSDGSKPVPTDTEFHVAAPDNRVDGEIVVADRTGRELGRWYLDRGRVYDPKGSESSTGVTVSVVRHEYLYDPGFDIGAFAGYAKGGDLTHFQPGVRLSPVRLLWGTTAPDIVATQQGAGAGVSFYPPAEYFGRWWNHVGVGGWYVAPYTGGDPSLVIGLSFSTRP